MNQQGWIVRANPHHIPRAEEFLRRNLIAVGWPRLPALYGLDAKAIRTTLAIQDPTLERRNLGRSVGILNTFINRIAIGDLIITPSLTDDSMHLGEVVGDYAFSEGDIEGCFPHQRPVKWLESSQPITKSCLPPQILKKLRAQQPIIALPTSAIEVMLKENIASKPELRFENAEFDTDGEVSAIEGIPKDRLVAYRSRSERLRRAKIKAALEATGGRLVCEVKGCGFDFEKAYGAVGRGFAHVHHLSELSKRGKRTTTVSDLKIVCANCHAMIHRNGVCRSIDTLISSTYIR